MIIEADDDGLHRMSCRQWTTAISQSVRACLNVHPVTDFLRFENLQLFNIIIKNQVSLLQLSTVASIQEFASFDNHDAAVVVADCVVKNCVVEICVEYSEVANTHHRQPRMPPGYLQSSHSSQQPTETFDVGKTRADEDRRHKTRGRDDQGVTIAYANRLGKNEASGAEASSFIGADQGGRQYE